jgi:putative chitinase
MPLDASIAEECVRQGVYFAVEPHYLMAVAQLRSAMPSDPARQGPYRLTQAEWDANSNDDDFDVHFTPAEISSPLRQCAVFALMANRAFGAFVAANNRNPSARELYLQQFPGADATGLQGALDDTAALVGPAADAVLDEPQAVSTIPNATTPTSGPPNITPDPIPPVPGVPGATLTLAMLQRRWSHADPALIQGMAATAGVLGRLGINTPLRMAHFMGQITQESGGGTEMTEKLSYSAERMMEVFPSRFLTLASTQGFVHNERPFGNKVYNGRMRNQPGTDDGFNFRGRGCLQLTGRVSYDAVGRSLTLDLVNNPDLVNAPQNVLLIAGTEFVKLGCLPECDRDNVVQVSARINLGHPTNNPGAINGLDERRNQLRIWKQEFGVA